MSARTDVLTVGGMMTILRMLPPMTRLSVLSEDGVEEFPFSAPTITRQNIGSPDEFAAINIVVSE